MAITYVNNALGSNTATTSFSIALPATQAGDIIILEYTHRATADATIGGTYSGPAFVEKHDQQFATSTFSGKTLWSRATGNHSAQTVTGSGLTDSVAAIVTVYRGALASGDPLTGATIVGEQNASGNVTQAEITTTVAGALVVLVVANSPDFDVSLPNSTSPGTLVERAERLSTGGTDTSISHNSRLKEDAGATGAFTWSQTSSASGSWAYAIVPEPAFDQNEAGFYEDGTETGSTVIDAGADSITRDVSSGDSNLQLRVRVQETAGASGATIDDWQLQYELNDSGAYVDVSTSTEALLDSYPTSNQGASTRLSSTQLNAVGQSFTGDGNVLTSAKFYLSKVGSPTGNAVAKLYAHTGTYGSSSLPTGTPLDTSSTFDVSTLTTDPIYTLASFTFSGGYTLVAATNYVIVVTHESEFPIVTWDGSNYIRVGIDTTSPTHAGNESILDDAGTWSLQSFDVIFYVYTANAVIGFNSASLTDGNATTNRLGAGLDLEFVGADAAQANTITIPAHQAGDLLLIYAFRDGSTTAPSLPASPAYWRSIGANTGTLTSSIVGYLIADSSSEVSGTWSNASSLVVHVYRYQSKTTRAVLNSAGASGTGTTVDYAGIGGMTDAGVSWVARFAGHTSIDTSLQTAPSGHTNRATNVGATSEVAGHDSNGPAASSSFGQVVAGGTSGNWLTKTLEILSAKFIAGEISEDGLVDNLQITAGNHTELLYSLTIESTAVADGDTLDFRVLRNGATTGMTYTVTPRITIESGIGDTPLVVADSLSSSTLDGNLALVQANTLVVADATSSSTLDNVALTQANTLVVADALSSSTLDNVDLVQNYTLTVADLLSSSTLDGNLSLTQANTLAVQDATSASTLENTDLTQANTLVVADSLSSSTLDNVVLVNDTPLVVADSLSSSTLDTVALTQQNTLAVADSLSSSTVDDVALTQAHTLAVADSLSSSTLDNTVLAQGNVLVVQDSLSSSTLDNVVLAQGNILVVADSTSSSTLDSVVLTQQYTLAVQDSLSSSTVDNTVLTQAHNLVVADSLSSSTVDNIVLLSGTVLVVADSLSSSILDSVAVTQANILSVQDALSSSSLDNLTLTQAIDLVIQDSLSSSTLEAIVLSVDGGGGVSGFKYFDGASFVIKPIKHFDGSTWNTAAIKRYNGVTWEELN